MGYKEEESGSVSLPQHSYWFDFCLFILFNIAFFLVIYFFCPITLRMRPNYVTGTKEGAVVTSVHVFWEVGRVEA